MSRTSAWSATLVCAITAGCHAPLTELVIVTDTDLSIPAELDAVRVEIDASALGGSNVIERSITLDGAKPMPIVQGLLHDGAGPLGPIEVRVIGLHGGRERVRSVARTRFLRERSLVLRMDLLRQCEGVVCDAGLTCDRDGGCVDAQVDPMTLPRWGSVGDAGAIHAVDAMVVEPGMDAGAMNALDAGTDGGPWIDPRCTGDASCCLASDECDDGCGCSGGCACDLRCSAGDTCADPIPFCSGAGTRCAFEANDSALFHFRCESGAYCVANIHHYATIGGVVCSAAECWLRCKDSSDCPIRCEDGASCVLLCDNAESCRFETCHADVLSCDDGVYTCNRECPSSLPAW